MDDARYESTLGAFRRFVARLDELPDETPILLALDPEANTYSAFEGMNARVFLGASDDFPPASRQPDGSWQGLFVYGTGRIRTDRE